MVEITNIQNYVIKNVLSYKGSVDQYDLPQLRAEIEEAVRTSGAVQCRNVITAVQRVSQTKYNVEVIVPLDRKTDDTGRFAFHDELNIGNALVASYKGSPSNVQDAYEKIKDYMSDNDLHESTMRYTEPVRVNPADPDDSEIRIFVGVASD
ncbi:MAG: hypothetical protein ACOYJI_01415 [Anaerovoracaceae bacterium]|jgi:effector-binding domain-containing protein